MKNLFLTLLLSLSAAAFAGPSPIIWGPGCAYNLYTQACLGGAGGVGTISALTGDVTASGTGAVAASVIRLQGRDLASTAPTAGQVIAWNGTSSAWEPTTFSAVTTLAAIGAAPNANGATISGNTLTLQPASVSFGGVITTGTQTLAGQKNFTGQLLTLRSTGTTVVDHGFNQENNAAATSGAVWLGKKSRGTFASPTAALSGDVLSNFAGMGYGATTYGTIAQGVFRYIAVENFTDSAKGTAADIFTTNVGSSSNHMSLSVRPDSELRIFDSAGTNYVGVIAAPTASYSLTLPVDAGTAGYILSTDGTGILSWIPAGGVPVLANNVSLKGRNAANTADIDIVKVSATDTRIFGDEGGNHVEVATNIGLFGTRINHHALGTVLLPSGGQPQSLDFADGTNTFQIRFTIPAVIASDVNFTLPGTAGTSGQFLHTDGTGNLTWQNATVTGNTNTVAYFDGSGNLSSNTGAKFVPATNSMALTILALSGTSTSSGAGSIVAGTAILSGDLSATGVGAEVHGSASTAGSQLLASGNASLVRGTATGGASLIASGIGSYIGGTAPGISGSSSGLASFAHGSEHTVSSNFGTAFGLGHVVSSFAALVAGRYALATGTPTSWVATDPVFVVGNGASIGSPANAMTVLKNGFGSVGIATPSRTWNMNRGDGLNVYAQWTAGTSTGTTADDGLLIGLDSSQKADLMMTENQPMSFGTNGQARMQVNDNGHLRYIGDPPTPTSCGTGATIVGNDKAGRVTIGTAYAGSCTFAFDQTWTTAPVCHVTGETAVGGDWVIPSTTDLNADPNNDFSSGDVFNYSCVEFE